MTQEILKLKDLAAHVQRGQIETTLVQLCSSLHFMRESLWPGNKEDMLVNQVEELTAPFQRDRLEPNTKADVVFSTLADLTAVSKLWRGVFTRSTRSHKVSCHRQGCRSSRKVVTPRAHAQQGVM